MIKKLLLVLFIAASLEASAGNKIKFYFNNPVDNSVAHGVNAVYLHNCMADTVVAYINRARYSIDIALYGYSQESYASIATAINSAYTRGVTVRWIYDGSAYNPSFGLLNAGIYKLGSPTTSSYGIMHNKFMIIDANSASANDAVVLTGSFNWSTSMFNYDYNNAVIIQDSALAHAYTGEFNMMWGGTGAAPNLALSKFGPHKTDLGRHDFIIDGTHVELYFSPSDGTDSHIQSAISSAKTDLYFGVYTFTSGTDASLIVSRHAAGVYAAGINDQYSNSYSPYGILTAGLGSNFKVYSGSDIYHNKYMIVDPSDACSDPLVLTGSHNWTTSADTKNDENTLIIHNDTAANIYLQSFRADFASLGGTLTTVGGCGLNAAVLTKDAAEVVSLYPNPAIGNVTVGYRLAETQHVHIAIFNLLGTQVAEVVNADQQQGYHSCECAVTTAGIYFVQFTLGSKHFTRKLVVSGN